MTRTSPDPMLIKYLDSKFNDLDEKIVGIREMASIGVQAKHDLHAFKQQLKAVWFIIGAIPVLGATLAYIGWIAPAHNTISNPDRHM